MNGRAGHEHGSRSQRQGCWPSTRANTLSHARHVSTAPDLLPKPPKLRLPAFIWLAGLILIAVGILCLFLSGAVMRADTWWQGTLQALGVGFVVGGIVDVLAISTMNQASIVAERGSQRFWNDQGLAIVAFAQTGNAPEISADRAKSLLEEHADVLDTELRAQLKKIATDPPRNITITDAEIDFRR
jgi:hypothetical protein